MRFAKWAVAVVLVMSTLSCASLMSLLVEDTKLTKQMIFDHQRNFDAAKKEYTASTLKAPYDAEASTRLAVIPELTDGNAAFDKDAYIQLVLTVGADGDTIKTAALILKNAKGDVRAISKNGKLQYLGAKGYVYISENKEYGYFIASAEHAYGESVNYKVVSEVITKKSQCKW